MRMAHRVLMTVDCFEERFGENRSEFEKTVCIDVENLVLPLRHLTGLGDKNIEFDLTARSLSGRLRTPFPSVFLEFTDSDHMQMGMWCRQQNDRLISVSTFQCIGGRAYRVHFDVRLNLDAVGAFDGCSVVPVGRMWSGASEEDLAWATPALRPYGWHLLPILCLSLLNCRRQTRVIERPDMNPAEKWLRRQKQPRLRYHTLDIDPLKKMLRYDEKADPTGRELAWHLCRGHWKHYTEEKPLFGRYVGSVWCPPHAKGKQENGVVLKEYALNIEGG